MNKSLKKVLIGCGLIVVFLIGIWLYKVAEGFILVSYSSGEVVLENTPQGTPLPIGGDNVEGSLEGNTDLIKPEQVYDGEASIKRSKEYLGDEYNDYAEMFKMIVAMGDQPFEGLDDSGIYTITDEKNSKGLSIAMGLHGDVDSLDDYDFCKIGSLDGGAEAVYFYDGSKVVYMLGTKTPQFFVVDYSNVAVGQDVNKVDFGGVFSETLYLIPEICNKEVIEGYTVYFSYQTDIVKDWE